jgi:hypothetical protein
LDTHMWHVSLIRNGPATILAEQAVRWFLWGIILCFLLAIAY